MSKEKDDIKGKLKIIATILLPVLAIIIPIALYMFQLKEMNLTYEVVSYSLLNLSSTIQDEIEVSFSGKKVTDLSAINIEIKNAGNTPIRKEDFEREISIDFGKDSKVLKLSIKYAFPLNLAPIIETKEQIIKISPLLLNQGDYFALEAIISNSSSEPQFDARIAGIKKASQIITKQISGTFLSNAILIITICILLIGYSFFAALLLISINPNIRKLKLLNYQPIALIALLFAIDSSFLIVRFRLIKSTSTLPVFEVLLYLAVIIFGVIMSFYASKKIRAMQYKEKENEINENNMAQQENSRAKINPNRRDETQGL